MLWHSENMRIRAYRIVLVLSALYIVPCIRASDGHSAAPHEYQIKAAFLYQFMKFVDWPKEKVADSNEPLIIGILGKDPFGDAFEPLRNKKVDNRKTIIRRYETLEGLKQSSEENETELHRRLEALRKCHLLFICSSENKYVTAIINSVKSHGVLTVADMIDFLESGGIINLIIEDKRIRFEISAVAAEQAKLKVRSQLLRLAKRVIKQERTRKTKSTKRE